MPQPDARAELAPTIARHLNVTLAASIAEASALEGSRAMVTGPRSGFANAGEAIKAALALHRAVAAIGGPARFAARIGAELTEILAWTFCPAQHVETVAAASGVSRHDLRPDLYPRGAATRDLTPEEAVAAYLRAGSYFARTGRCLSAAEGH
ncbi:hypothetical protein [Methylobacterium brachiatum]|uniref:hypothetical protein n=1 Tax=Methylobacterium brachiatum TaxID=269660 RepID=UPI00244CE197|nr:hypothetical protein [Methylobacterium brachiatum]MDH2310370.1 hypothetical protein [Methylobacterium brachiatum]